jgi:hypothetical protein
MIIKTIETQNRRDFTAIYICEHCGAERTGHGYDDENFHLNVIPRMKCDSCGATADENYQPRTTKYTSGQVV